ncbi:unnamed protein product [Pedinophyceae sp. YPF-701]|nr:unnamed protein product [Pedinophyceae sp. YPF-701]
MYVWEIYDASTEELEEHLRILEAKDRGPAESQLLAAIQEEIRERGASAAVHDDIFAVLEDDFAAGLGLTLSPAGSPRKVTSRLDADAAAAPPAYAPGGVFPGEEGGVKLPPVDFSSIVVGGSGVPASQLPGEVSPDGIAATPRRGGGAHHTPQRTEPPRTPQRVLASVSRKSLQREPSAGPVAAWPVRESPPDAAVDRSQDAGATTTNVAHTHSPEPSRPASPDTAHPSASEPARDPASAPNGGEAAAAADANSNAVAAGDGGDAPAEDDEGAADGDAAQEGTPAPQKKASTLSGLSVAEVAMRMFKKERRRAAKARKAQNEGAWGFRGKAEARKREEEQRRRQIAVQAAAPAPAARLPRQGRSDRQSEGEGEDEGRVAALLSPAAPAAAARDAARADASSARRKLELGLQDDAGGVEVAEAAGAEESEREEVGRGVEREGGASSAPESSLGQTEAEMGDAGEREMGNGDFGRTGKFSIAEAMAAAAADPSAPVPSLLPPPSARPPGFSSSPSSSRASQSGNLELDSDDSWVDPGSPVARSDASSAGSAHSSRSDASGASRPESRALVEGAQDDALAQWGLGAKEGVCAWNDGDWDDSAVARAMRGDGSGGADAVELSGIDEVLLARARAHIAAGGGMSDLDTSSDSSSDFGGGSDDEASGVGGGAWADGLPEEVPALPVIGHSSGSDDSGSEQAVDVAAAQTTVPPAQVMPPRAPQQPGGGGGVARTSANQIHRVVSAPRGMASAATDPDASPPRANPAARLRRLASARAAPSQGGGNSSMLAQLQLPAIGPQGFEALFSSSWGSTGTLLPVSVSRGAVVSATYREVLKRCMEWLRLATEGPFSRNKALFNRLATEAVAAHATRGVAMKHPPGSSVLATVLLEAAGRCAVTDNGCPGGVSDGPIYADAASIAGLQRPATALGLPARPQSSRAATPAPTVGSALPGLPPDADLEMRRSTRPKRYSLLVRTVEEHPEVLEVLSLAMRGKDIWEMTAEVTMRPPGWDPAVPLPANAAVEVRRDSVHGPVVDPREAATNLWNVLWTWSNKVHVDHDRLLSVQRVNHFPEARHLTRKDLLGRHMARQRRMFAGTRFEGAFARFPTSYELPRDLPEFMYSFAVAGGDRDARPPVGAPPPPPVAPAQGAGRNVWILKPVAQSKGRGIFLTEDWDEAARELDEGYVAQRYLTRPMLLEGHKFDLRVYCLVTSFQPLEAALYTEGFARFAPKPYSMDDLSDLGVHLTNASLHAEDLECAMRLPPELNAYLGEDNLPAEMAGCDLAREALNTPGGTKISLGRLWSLLAARGLPSRDQIWPQVCEAALAALFAVGGEIRNRPSCFELFGIDLIIDEQGQVWLLEANASPSMVLLSALDRIVKPRLLGDAVEAAAAPPFDRAALAEALQRRMGLLGRGHQRRQGLLSGTASGERELAESDMAGIFPDSTLGPGGSGIVAGCVPGGRKWPGLFEALAPSKLLEQLQRAQPRSSMGLRAPSRLESRG